MVHRHSEKHETLFWSQCQFKVHTELQHELPTEPTDQKKHSLSGIQCRTESRQLDCPKRDTAQISKQNETRSFGEKLKARSSLEQPQAGTNRLHGIKSNDKHFSSFHYPQRKVSISHCIKKSIMELKNESYISYQKAMKLRQFSNRAVP